MSRSFVLLLIVQHVTTFDGSGNDAYVEFDESVKAPFTIDAINNLLRPFAYKAFNVTFQLEIMRALEAINRGRLELTLWSHEYWKISNLSAAAKLLHYRNLLKLHLNSRSELEFSPEMVFKNALYFKEHRTPLLNTILEKCIKYELCGVDITEDQYHNGVDAICELHYGSLIHDSTEVNLNWASNNVQESNLPCSIHFVPHCVIKKIRLSKKEITFLGEKYDELVACFLLSFSAKDYTMI
uniref:FBD domain-containing protein n=1 Tax=Elaeophora elaphi TaxID=1147741 RepID=A0A0R3RRB5_9BILA